MLAFSPSHAAINGTEGRIHVESRLPLPGGFHVYGPDNQLQLTFVDNSGIQGSDGLCRQAVWAAIHISEGLLESPMHPLSASIAVLELIDQAREQLHRAY